MNHGQTKRKALYEIQKGLCAYCDRPLPNPEAGQLDHIFPKSKGGKRHNNLALVCPRCNAIKQNIATYAEAFQYCRLILRMFKRLEERAFIPVTSDKPVPEIPDDDVHIRVGHFPDIQQYAPLPRPEPKPSFDISEYAFLEPKEHPPSEDDGFLKK